MEDKKILNYLIKEENNFVKIWTLRLALNLADLPFKSMAKLFLNMSLIDSELLMLEYANLIAKSIDSIHCVEKYEYLIS